MRYLRALGLALRPVAQLRQHRRLVWLGDLVVGRLQMRIAGAAEPDVAVRIVLLRAHAGIDLAGAHARHVDLDAGLLLVRVGDGAAPFLIDAAIHHELALGLGVVKRNGGQRSRASQSVA